MYLPHPNNREHDRDEKKTSEARQHAPVNVRGRRELLWVATNLGILALWLIHPYPIDGHDSGESQMRQVHFAKVFGHAQVRDQILR